MLKAQESLFVLLSSCIIIYMWLYFTYLNLFNKYYMSKGNTCDDWTLLRLSDHHMCYAEDYFSVTDKYRQEILFCKP